MYSHPRGLSTYSSQTGEVPAGGGGRMGPPASLRGMQAEMLYPASPHVPGPAVSMRQAHAD